MTDSKPTKPAAGKKTKAKRGAKKKDHGVLRDTVSVCVRQYLDEIDGEMTTDFYQLVLSQVEAPLLEEIMVYTRNNQTKAAMLLGLNRGTLRKKLRQYNIADDS